MISLQRVFLTLDRTKAVPENDKDAQWLLIHEGGEIHEKELAKYEGATELCGKPPEGRKHPVTLSEAGDDGLEEFTKADLQTLAGSEEIDLLTAKTKPEILARIRTARKEKVGRRAS